MSTYTTNIPLSAQKIKNTTSLIRANFDNLAAGLSNDHANINDPTSGTRLTHDKVRLNKQALDPSTTSTQVALYSKDVQASAINYPELFFRRVSNGSAIQMTTGGLTPQLGGDYLDPPTVNSTGYTFLPGGLVYYWGIVLGGFTNNAAVQLPQITGRVIKKIYSLNCQPWKTVPPNETYFYFVNQLINTTTPATFRVLHLKLDGITGSADEPTIFQAIVELGP
jgi:hypothetical protein